MAKHKFRRGQRVEVKMTEWDHSTKPATRVEVWRVGSVTNPSADKFYGSYVRVRMDSQQAYETGNTYRETDVRADVSGRTEYELRHYDLRYLSHTEIAALKIALENVNVRDDTLTDDMVQGLLRKLPSLP